MLYLDQQSEKFKLELNSIFRKYFPEIKVFIMLVNKRTIESFFPYKDKLPLELRSSLVYQLSQTRETAAFGGISLALRRSGSVGADFFYRWRR